MTDLPRPRTPDGNPHRIVLGIDPGTQVLGYGAVVMRHDGPRLLAAGVLRTPRKADIPTRLGWLRVELDDLLERLRPAVVVVEEAFAGKNPQSALRIGEARGVVLACAASRVGEVVQFPPAVAKRSLVGHGAAGKEQVARMVAVELGLDEPPASQDATDALALALTYVHRARIPGSL